MQEETKKNRSITPKQRKINILNFNLKNEIFSYLPYNIMCLSIFPVCKKFSSSIRESQAFKIVSAFEAENKKINASYSVQDFEAFVKDKNYSLETNIMDLFEYIIRKKFKDQTALSLKESLSENALLNLEIILPKHNNLKVLDLSVNGIGKNEQYMQQLKRALSANTSLTTLNLGFSSLGGSERSMEILKEILLANPSITTLILSWNFIGMNEKNMQHLADALLIGNSLTILDLWENIIFNNENFVQIFKRTIQATISLKTLILRENLIGKYNVDM